MQEMILVFHAPASFPLNGGPPDQTRRTGTYAAHIQLFGVNAVDEDVHRALTHRVGWGLVSHLDSGGHKARRYAIEKATFETASERAGHPASKGLMNRSSFVLFSPLPVYQNFN